MSDYFVISRLHQESNTLLMYLRQHYLRCKTVYRGINHLGIELAPGGRASLPQTWGARDDRDTNSSATGGFAYKCKKLEHLVHRHRHAIRGEKIGEICSREMLCDISISISYHFRLLFLFFFSFSFLFLFSFSFFFFPCSSLVGEGNETRTLHHHHHWDDWHTERINTSDGDAVEPTPRCLVTSCHTSQVMGGSTEALPAFWAGVGHYQ